MIIMVEVFIENIIASATISDELELETIIQALPGCEYNPDQFSGVIYRPEKPRVVILIFNNGKIMVTAAKSIDDVKTAMTDVEKLLKDKGLLKPPKKKKEEAQVKPPEEQTIESEEQKDEEDDEKKTKNKTAKKSDEKGDGKKKDKK